MSTPASNEGAVYRRILLPLDGSPRAAAVLPVAHALAVRHAATLHVLLVEAPATPVMGAPAWDPGFDDATRLARRRTMQEIADGLGARGEVRVITRVVIGDVAECIEEEVDHVGADLVIVSARGAGVGTGRLGSVPRRLLYTLRVPLLIQRSEMGERDVAAYPVWSEMPPFPFHDVLVPVEDDDETESSVGRSMFHARALGGPDAHYTLLAVVSTLVALMAPHSAPHVSPSDEQSGVRAAPHLEPFAATARASGLSVSSRSSVNDQPVRGIVRYASENACDLIVMRSHARRGLARALSGSVAALAARRAHASVLVLNDPSRADV